MIFGGLEREGRIIGRKELALSCLIGHNNYNIRQLVLPASRSPAKENVYRTNNRKGS
jgi:hypothetical protein